MGGGEACEQTAGAASTRAPAPCETFDGDSTVREHAAEGRVVLPGGYVASDGTAHRDVQLAPVTGKDEEIVGSLPPDVCMATVVTALLSRTIKRLGPLSGGTPALARDLLVGDREYLILKLRELTLGRTVDALLHCEDARCGAAMHVSFSLADVQVAHKALSRRFFAMQLSPAAADGSAMASDCRVVEFRLPTGADVEAGAAQINVDEADALDRLLARCVRRVGSHTRVDPALIAALGRSARHEIEAEMERLAPAVAIELETACPECRRPQVISFDLARFFLAELNTGVSALEREVHRIARHYHWSEDDILSLPRRKRRRYLELIQEDGEHGS